MRELYDERFTPADEAVLRHKARRLVGHYGYSATDLDDVRQELALRVFPRTRVHDPARGTRAGFVKAVADRCLVNLIEYRTAKRRDGRRDVSAAEAGERLLVDAKTSPERVDLQLDVRSALAGLPAELREVAARLAWQSEAAVARDMGLTRSAVRYRVGLIREHLAAAGLGGILPD